MPDTLKTSMRIFFDCPPMRICTVTAAFNYRTKAAAVRDELEGKYIHKVNASGFLISCTLRCPVNAYVKPAP
jgi:hypothetical protein